MKQISFLILFTILLSSFALGIGLSYEYMEDDTLKLGPGENYFFKLILQNEQSEDITVNVTIIDSEIAELVGGGLVNLEADTYDNFVYFNITIPREALIGDVYDVRFSVGPSGEVGEGQVPFSLKYDRTLKVTIVEKEGFVYETPSDIENVVKEKNFWQNYWITILVILIVIIAVLVYLFKPKSV